ncbi:double-strand break repair helicase AddA [Neokomagataea thailandica]|uniref:DNA 3'-5' helicase n=1 Tax=Neokomagataea tanensis NBRC 106556 TaxID=1223519 RepID=A0ABQ0QJA9_9PROT|nr:MULTISPECIES: double-strand break repair helicase AddA [Neokomagataea]GBR46809.1 DNA helicase II [Neokomagataea tanensis NBRC 106556]
MTGMTVEHHTAAAAKAQANKTQSLASDPMASVFVSASAGSGKTKLLIDRLLRLMLPLEVNGPDGVSVVVEGANPSRIVCLTYTKAAAAEMAHRLQAKLGAWVSLSDDALGAELAGLSVPNLPETRAAARGLFLKVLDLPGGLRIETIHAFCQSLLRRFPLEASIDPHFDLMEETDTLMALRAAMEDELARSPQRVAELAGNIGLEVFFKTLQTLNNAGNRLEPLLAALAAQPERLKQFYNAAVEAGSESVEELEAMIKAPPEADAFRREFNTIYDASSDAAKKKLNDALGWLGSYPEDRSTADWQTHFLTQKGEIRAKWSHLVGAKVKLSAPELEARLDREAQRLVALSERMRAVALSAINQAIMALATSILQGFRDGKAARGLVDYGDLIRETRNLLDDPGAAWVLYKLDGGIDHLLLDEVQDNSGVQWEIAGALTSEFFAGEAARDAGLRPRTIFAVGDYKQSIYGFQGADPDQFHYWRGEFARRVRAAGLLWRDPELNVSFRSVAPVLNFVDVVFSLPDAAKGLREGEDSTLLPHISARSGEGGRVELWPLVPVDDESDGEVEAPSSWEPPSRNYGQRSAQQRLAESLGAWVAQQIGRSPQPGKAPLKAGEILILVPRRSSFLRALIRSLKGKNVPVATMVRVGLTETVAVRDLMTLCAALLLPQDDLMLASVLTSPLGGLTDESLMALATKDGRGPALGKGGQPLWTVLRGRHQEREDWRAAWRMLSGLYTRVDYATPYRLLSEALGQYSGRARLLQRLGEEAVEPVDELLSAALRYEGLHPPSLQGFLHWLEASNIESKREAESGGDAVRVMTVHGSKGLQARLVVMPDTVASGQKTENLYWSEAEGVELPLMVPRVDAAVRASSVLADEQKARAEAERNRLLYVALTRASDWLVVCGAMPKKGIPETSWYRQCEAGFEALGERARKESCDDLPWGGERWVLDEQSDGSDDRVVPASPSHEAVSAPVVPAWMGRAPYWVATPAEREDAMTRPLAPSRPDGAEYGPQVAVRSPLEHLARRKTVQSIGEAVQVRRQAMRRGTMIHRLLQLLPDVAPVERSDVAAQWLGRAALGLEAGEIDHVVQQVLAVLDDARLAPLFLHGSRAEQPISGVSRGRVVLGQVDRLWVGPDEVWVCDYKTNRMPPSRVERTPIAYVRQMAAYRDVLAQLYPNAAIRCVLVWTEGAQVHVLPQSLLESVWQEGLA